MLDCLTAIQDRWLPAIAVKAVAVARRFFLSRDVDQKAVDEARVMCWNYLEAHGHGSELEDPEAIATRAVICVLYPKPPTDDGEELLEWFLSLVNRLEDRSAEQSALLKKHFPTVS